MRTAIPPGLPRLRRHQPDDHHRHPADAGRPANADGKILPGLYTRVRVPLEQRRALLVPEVAVGHDQQGDYLLVVNDKNVVEAPPRHDRCRGGEPRVIATGLTVGEWVVVNGVLKAAPGRPVTPDREGAPGRRPVPRFRRRSAP